jgi:hypothetical protein
MPSMGSDPAYVVPQLDLVEADGSDEVVEPRQGQGRRDDAVDGETLPVDHV